MPYYVTVNCPPPQKEDINKIEILKELKTFMSILHVKHKMIRIPHPCYNDNS
jgi:hypothetical protein